jgi:protein SCO1/2
MILLAGVGLGLMIRAIRPRPAAGPAAGETVYSNDPGELAAGPQAVENPQPSYPAEKLVSQFELVERSGKTVSSDELLGQPYVVSFFFSNCPSVCIQQNTKLKELQDMFAGQGVRFVAISVDPETDTPERLREYAARFGADPEQWLFMTGDLLYIRQLGAASFHQPVDKQFHSERFVLVDTKGEVEGFYSWPDQQQFTKLQESIRRMLEQPAGDGA